MKDERAGNASDAAELIERVGARVRAIRKGLKMSRRELSERSGVSPRYLAKLEAGNGNISIGLLSKVASALGLSIEQVFQPDDPASEDARRVAERYKALDPAIQAKIWQMLDPAKHRAQKAARLCLIGLRGAGKSTLGALISNRFAAPFIELNTEIEAAAGIPISEIIALYGQDGYRQLEADTLAQIIKDHDRAVIAVAGGIVSEEETFRKLLTQCHSVWVKASASEHMDRVRAQGDMRPMAGNPQAMIQLRQLLKQREGLYGQADHLIDTSGLTLDASVAELTELVRANGLLGQGADDSFKLVTKKDKSA